MSKAAGETMMSFEALLRREHFADFSAATQKRLGTGVWNARMRIAYLVGVFALTLVFMRLADRVALPLYPESWLGPGEVTVLALVAGLVLTFVLTAAMTQQLRRDYAGRALRDGGSYLGHRNFSLTGEGISAEGPHGRWTTYWSAIQELTEAPSTLMLWTDPGAAIMVPKDAFASDDDRTRFQALVAERIEAAKARISPLRADSSAARST